MKKKFKTKAKKFGTAKIKKFFDQVDSDTLLKVYRPHVEKLAYSAAEDVKTRIEMQLFKHTPLNPNYREWKKVSGLDTRILIRTAKLVESITVKEIIFPRGIGYRVGIDENARYKDGTPVALIDKAMEYGTSVISPRPHWRPVYRNLDKAINKARLDAEKDVSKYVNKFLMDMRSKGKKI